MNGKTQGAENPENIEVRYVARTPELRRKNNMVLMIAVAVALLLFIGAIIYVIYFGGVNKGPMQPLHSGLATALTEDTV